MTWLEGLFAHNLLLTMSVWAVEVVLDYVQTLRGARLYQEIRSRNFVTEGSYELNPSFVADIDKRRKFSYRLFLSLGWWLMPMMIVWWIASSIRIMQLFTFMAGSLMLPLLVIHMMHIRSISSAQYLKQHSEQVRGKVQTARSYSLHTRAVEFGTFGGLFLVLFAVTGSWFVAGGGAGCLGTAVRMLRWRRRAVSATAPAKAVAPKVDQTTPEAP